MWKLTQSAAKDSDEAEQPRWQVPWSLVWMEGALRLLKILRTVFSDIFFAGLSDGAEAVLCRGSV